MPSEERLAQVHYQRMVAHWGKKWASENAFAAGRWPQNKQEWNQTGHGAPWDSNVHMAEWHLGLAKKLAAEGLLED